MVDHLQVFHDIFGIYKELITNIIPKIDDKLFENKYIVL